MNTNTTTQGAAGASGGASLAITTIIIWMVGLIHITVPADVATAIVTVMTIGIHFAVTQFAPKNAQVNVPVETTGASVAVPTQTVPTEPTEPSTTVVKPPAATLSSRLTDLAAHHHA